MNSDIHMGNIARLQDWKEHKTLQEKEHALQKYYELLDFSQLISESKLLRKKLAKGEPIADMPLQTKLIFGEIQKRMICGTEQQEAVKSFISRS